MNCYFWHAFDLVDGGPDLIDLNYEHVREKFRAMATKALALRDGRRVVCIVSNTQPNLPEVVEAVGTMTSFVSKPELQALRDQLQATFGPAAELFFVTHPDLHSGTEVDGVRVIERGRDASSYWTGSARPWREVLTQIFA